MPEIAEVFRAADYIRQHLVGRTIAAVTAVDDPNVFGKVGTSGAEIVKSIKGKKIVGAGQQGKYFWITMDSPPHLLCHFGMSGWFHIKGIPTFYYKDTKKDKKADVEWPPRSWKFAIETKATGNDKTGLQAAFVDMRRFARVRLMHCAAEDMRKVSPLIENGPDPNTDKEIVTRDWLAELCKRKRAPIKAVLLDQANISGIGNWVGDEILFQARIHPEQYANTLSEAQIAELHLKLMEVVGIAIETKSDSDLFPETWLFKHRWGKGRKAIHELPTGEKITFLTVGGRTSAIVASLQKKLASDEEDDEGGEKTIPKASKGKGKAKSKKRKATESDSELEDPELVEVGDSSKVTTDELPPTATAEEAAEIIKSESKPARRGRKSNPKLSATETKEEPEDILDSSHPKRSRGRTLNVAKEQKESKSKASTPKASGKTTPSKKAKTGEIAAVAELPGRRRSGRLQTLQ